MFSLNIFLFVTVIKRRIRRFIVFRLNNKSKHPIERLHLPRRSIQTTLLYPHIICFNESDIEFTANLYGVFEESFLRKTQHLSDFIIKPLGIGCSAQFAGLIYQNMTRYGKIILLIDMMLLLLIVK